MSGKPKNKPVKPAPKQLATKPLAQIYHVTLTRLFQKGTSEMDVGFYMKLWNEMMRMSSLSLIFTFAVFPLVSVMLFALAFTINEYILVPSIGIAFAAGTYSYTSANLRRKMSFYRHQLGGIENIILADYVRKIGDEAERIYGPKKLIEKIKASFALYIGIPAIWFYLIMKNL